MAESPTRRGKSGEGEGCVSGGPAARLRRLLRRRRVRAHLPRRALHELAQCHLCGRDCASQGVNASADSLLILAGTSGSGERRIPLRAAEEGHRAQLPPPPAPAAAPATPPSPSPAAPPAPTPPAAGGSPPPCASPPPAPPSPCPPAPAAAARAHDRPTTGPPAGERESERHEA